MDVDFPFILSVLLFSLLMSFRKGCAGCQLSIASFRENRVASAIVYEAGLLRQQQLIKYLEYVPPHSLGVVLLIDSIMLCGMVCLHSG